MPAVVDDQLGNKVISVASCFSLYGKWMHCLRADTDYNNAFN